jgi:hypothetical protein
VYAGEMLVVMMMMMVTMRRRRRKRTTEQNGKHQQRSQLWDMKVGDDPDHRISSKVLQ